MKKYLIIIIIIAGLIYAGIRQSNYKSPDEAFSNSEISTNDQLFEDAYNNRGGIVHWTHHDPDGYHEDGWLKHNGRKYQ